MQWYEQYAADLNNDFNLMGRVRHPGRRSLKDPFAKIVKKKPKLLVNHLVTSIRVGDRTKMMLRESDLGRTSMKLD